MHHRAGSLVLFASLAACSFSNAQANSGDNPSDQSTLRRGSIEGTLSRPDGGPLHDIRIEVRASDTDQLVATRSTNQSGAFEALDLPSGSYELVAADGRIETRERVEVGGDTTRVRLLLAPTAFPSPKVGTISVIELRTPEKARELTAKAGKALVKNRLEEARKDIRRALAIAPHYPSALTTRAVLELTEQRPQEAAEDLHHATSVDPSYGPAYVVMGAAMNELGRYDEALWNLKRSYMYDPKSWQCAFETSKAWMGKRDYDHAVEQLNRAEKLGARRVLAPIHLLRGYALIAQKHFEQARADLESYLTAEPNGKHAGSARAALAKVRTFMVQAPDAVTLPVMPGMFTEAQ